MLAEPPPTGADLRFSLFGFPVRVHPFFWLGTLLLGMAGGNRDPKIFVFWVIIVFVSILVHELGHAFAMRKFGLSARIVLHGFGGLAIPDQPRWGMVHRMTGRRQILISLAGPIAGFILAGIIIGLSYAFLSVQFHVPNEEGFFPVTVFAGEANVNVYLIIAINLALWVNILWGLMNLLPVYPLDGGQVAREVFLKMDADRGMERSLICSIIFALLAAAFGLYARRLWMGFLFGYLAFENYRVMQAMKSRRGW